MPKNVPKSGPNGDDLPPWHQFAVELHERLFDRPRLFETRPDDKSGQPAQQTEDPFVDLDLVWAKSEADESGADVRGDACGSAAPSFVGKDEPTSSQVDAEIALLVARIAETLFRMPEVFMLAASPGRITLIDVGDVRALSQTKALVERGLFPAEAESGSGKLHGLLPGYVRILAPETYDNAVSDSAWRTFATKVSAALNSRHSRLILLTSGSDLPPELAAALPPPTLLVQASQEALIFALGLTHRETSQAQRIEPPRVYRRVVCSMTKRPYRESSGLHRTPPLLLRAGYIRWG